MPAETRRAHRCTPRQILVDLYSSRQSRVPALPEQTEHPSRSYRLLRPQRRQLLNPQQYRHGLRLSPSLGVWPQGGGVGDVTVLGFDVRPAFGAGSEQVREGVFSRVVPAQVPYVAVQLVHRVPFDTPATALYWFGGFHSATSRPCRSRLPAPRTSGPRMCCPTSAAILAWPRSRSRLITRRRTPQEQRNDDRT